MVNDSVLDSNFCFLLCPFILQFFFDFLLLADRALQVNNLPFKCLNLRLNIIKLILSDLQVSLGPQTHIGDLRECCIVFLLDLCNFFLSIVLDLVHRLVVVSLHGKDILL